MLKNFDAPLFNLDGSTTKMVDADGKPSLNDKGVQKVLTLKELVTTVLMANLEDDKQLTGSQKIGLISLAMRVNEGGPREYSPEDLSLIRSRAEKAQVSHIHYFRLCELIDAKEKDTPEAKGNVDGSDIQ